jgi:hypothetical protein
LKDFSAPCWKALSICAGVSPRVTSRQVPRKLAPVLACNSENHNNQINGKAAISHLRSPQPFHKASLVTSAPFPEVAHPPAQTEGLALTRRPCIAVQMAGSPITDGLAILNCGWRDGAFGDKSNPQPCRVRASLSFPCKAVIHKKLRAVVAAFCQAVTGCDRLGQADHRGGTYGSHQSGGIGR